MPETFGWRNMDGIVFFVELGKLPKIDRLVDAPELEGCRAAVGRTALVAIARDELRRILGLTAEPVFHTVARWPESMAQYNVGHAARVQQIEARAAVLPGLHLAGNAFRGIGIPDCVSTGRQAAADILTLRTHKRDD